jgi:PAS domain S-box-containing protein
MQDNPVKFLLVDDLEANLLALSGLLRRDGVELLQARSGREALELLLVHDVALAVIDVQMPVMDGFELAELMRGAQRTRHVPIMFLTAGTHDNQRRFRGYEAGAVDFLYKPIEQEILRSKADIFLELYRQRQEIARQRDRLLAIAEEKSRLLKEQVEAVHRMRESEERFRRMADHAPMTIWLTEADGACVYLSKSWYEVTGQTPDTGSGFGWLQAVHPDDRATVKKAFHAAHRRHDPFRLEYRLRRHDGEYRHVLDSSAPRVGAKGEFEGYIGSVLDITERKQAEEALSRLNEELEVRVEERTRELVLSQGRLRDLATELNLTEQRERQRLAAELHDYLAQLLVLCKIKLAQAKQQPSAPPVTKALTDMQDIMDKALTYTRTLVTQLSPPVLNEFGLRVALAWLGEQMKERDLTVSLEVEQDFAPLPEDQGMLLFQSVRELLMNVVKHGNTDQASITVTQAEGSLHITVADQGAGFDLDAAATARPVPGFGLFSIRERMIALGGRFELGSRPGRGTQATLIMPLALNQAKVESGMRSDER